jgi:hypothetical protein
MNTSKNSWDNNMQNQDLIQNVTELIEWHNRNNTHISGITWKEIDIADKLVKEISKQIK